jgi:hypothetical protein
MNRCQAISQYIEHLPPNWNDLEDIYVDEPRGEYICERDNRQITANDGCVVVIEFDEVDQNDPRSELRRTMEVYHIDCFIRRFNITDFHGFGRRRRRSKRCSKRRSKRRSKRH